MRFEMTRISWCLTKRIQTVVFSLLFEYEYGMCLTKNFPPYLVDPQKGDNKKKKSQQIRCV